MTTTSVPSVSVASNGITTPAESDILTGVLTDIDTAFGGGLNKNLTTPQGLLAQAETRAIGNQNDAFVSLANQFDPAYASGRFQDALGRIYNLTRVAAAGSVVTVIAVGAATTVIPAGIILGKDNNGYLWQTTGATQIGDSGQIPVELQCTTTGPIACPAGTLTTIYTSVQGLDAISNPAAASLGNNVESRSEFEARRQKTLALNGTGSTAAVRAAVWAVSGVLDCYVIDNKLSSTVTVGSTSYRLVPHSILVSVIGGADSDIAAAINRKIDVGCDFNGNTSVVVRDLSYITTTPAITVKFLRPGAAAFKFAVSILNNSNLPSDIVTQVQNAIIAQFTGSDGTHTSEAIGGRVVAGSYYSTVAALNPNVVVTSILLGTSTPTLAYQDVGVDQYPTVSASDITVTLI